MVIGFSSISSKYEVYFPYYGWSYIHNYILFFFFYTRVKKVMNYSCVSKDALLGSCVQLLVRDV